MQCHTPDCRMGAAKRLKRGENAGLGVFRVETHPALAKPIELRLRRESSTKPTAASALNGSISGVSQRHAWFLWVVWGVGGYVDALASRRGCAQIL